MYVSPCDPQKCNHVKPTALRREEKIANIEITQSPGAGQGPAAATACSLPSASHGEAGRGAQGWAQAPKGEAWVSWVVGGGQEAPPGGRALTH